MNSVIKNLRFSFKKLFRQQRDKELEFFMLCQKGKITAQQILEYTSYYKIDVNVEYYADRNSNFLLTGTDSITPMMFYLSSSNPDTEIVKEFLSWKVNPNHQSRLGHTSVSFMRKDSAFSLGNLKLLKQAGADFDLKNCKGQTCLYSFLECGTAEQLVFLKSASCFLLDSYELNSIYDKESGFYAIHAAIDSIRRRSYSDSLTSIYELPKIIDVLLSCDYIDLRVKTKNYKKLTPLQLVDELIKTSKHYISTRAGLEKKEHSQRLEVLEQIRGKVNI